MNPLDIVRGVFEVRGARGADTERRARLLVQTAVVIGLFVIAARLTAPDDQRNRALFRFVIPFGGAACILTLILARRARVDAAALVLAAFALVAIAVIAWTEGPDNPRLGNTVLAIAAIGCVLRTRLTVAFGLTLAALVVGLALARHLGLYAPPHETAGPLWLPFVRQVVAVGLMALVLRRSYDRLHAQVVEGERASSAAVEAARTFNASLEDRVAQGTASLSATRDRLDTLARQLTDSLTADLDAMREQLRRFLDAEAGLGAARLDDVASAAAAADRLMAMIERLHEHARLGVAALRPAAIDMTALVRAVVAELGRFAGTAAIEWTIDALPCAWADPTLIRTVIENLLTNAVKFSRAREPPRIHVGFDAGSNRYFVRDNGVGFDPRRAGKLFTPFQRLHRADEFEGHGLGLANVRRIVGRAGGLVAAEGTPDRGAAIYFELPGAKGAA